MLFDGRGFLLGGCLLDSLSLFYGGLFGGHSLLLSYGRFLGSDLLFDDSLFFESGLFRGDLFDSDLLLYGLLLFEGDLFCERLLYF